MYFQLRIIVFLSILEIKHLIIDLLVNLQCIEVNLKHFFQHFLTLFLLY